MIPPKIPTGQAVTVEIIQTPSGDFAREYVRVDIPSDFSTNPKERGEQAITEAREIAHFYVMPANWTVISDDGEEVIVARDRATRPKDYGPQVCLECHGDIFVRSNHFDAPFCSPHCENANRKERCEFGCEICDNDEQETDK